MDNHTQAALERAVGLALIAAGISITVLVAVLLVVLATTLR